MNKLDQLKTMTSVVADSGDIASIADYQPEDATTNPSLILKAATLPQYQHLVKDAVNQAQKKAPRDNWIDSAMDRLAVNFGLELLKQVPGKVSTEVDAHLSFDTDAMINKAHKLIALYEQQGISRDRVLIKLAATWEGIQAGKHLEAEGIHCNLTLIFNMAQAIACAQAGIFLISPFVGRILDWHLAHANIPCSPAEDPGVQFVTEVFNYYKHFDYKTVVMGASFRNIGQIEQLAGCDRLTISPDLLQELTIQQNGLNRKLFVNVAKQQSIKKQHLNQAQFRMMMNEDTMATEKLAEGIRNFHADYLKLRQCIMNQH